MSNIKFKVFKTGIRISESKGVDYREPRTIKLSYPMWEAFSRLKGHPADEDIPNNGFSCMMISNLHDRQLLTEYAFYAKLTKFARAIHMVIPECPDRQEWPEGCRRKTLLTATQQELIDHWTQGLSDAIPDGSLEPQTARWQNERRPDQLDELVLRGFVERGVQGMSIEDGKIEIQATRSDSLRIVYRLTPHGALLRS